MFGYVRAYKPDMTFAQYDIYKGVYCSLCKQIGRRYGLLARLTLSYDLTFFALFRLALKNKCTAFHKSHCSFNPLKKCFACEKDNEEISLAADISMLMVYYKYIDNLNDTSGIKRFFLKLLSPYFRRIKKKAQKNCPEADVILSLMTEKQLEAEKSNAGIDVAAHPSADALGKLLSLNINDENIYRFGYLIGRWVYIADASDDYDDDIKSGGFNPLKSKNKADAMKKAREALNFTLSEATELFEELQMNCYKPILKNIIFEGMYRIIKEITSCEVEVNDQSI